MNNIKSTFLIQDLAVLSGIKAHTIRIWEKRYHLLEPMRMNRNVRLYDLASLQKLLNISILNSAGHKISIISKLNDEQIAEQAKEVALNSFSKTYAINSVIMAMYSFDEEAFQKIYNEEIKRQGFDELFVSVYIPVLKYMGILWQTDSIKPVHEHFISNLIFQKVTMQTNSLKYIKPTAKDTYILFLPDGEMHEIGLLFLNYLLRKNGASTLYLGRGIPLNNLLELKERFKKIVWISGLVIDKTPDNKLEILQSIDQLLMGTKNKCWLVGQNWSNVDANQSKNVKYYENFEDLINKKKLMS